MKRETIATIIEDLQAGRTPVLAVEDFPAFSEEATAGDPHIGPETLQAIAATLTEADIPTFERALRAMDEGDLAWLGFKGVYDAAAAQGNVDNEVTKKYGEQGSADGEPLVFFCNDAKEIVASREPSSIKINSCGIPARERMPSICPAAAGTISCSLKAGITTESICLTSFYNFDL